MGKSTNYKIGDKVFTYVYSNHKRKHERCIGIIIDIDFFEDGNFPEEGEDEYLIQTELGRVYRLKEEIFCKIPDFTPDKEYEDLYE